MEDGKSKKLGTLCLQDKKSFCKIMKIYLFMKFKVLFQL